MNATELLQRISQGLLHPLYPRLYGPDCDLATLDARFASLIKTHQATFADDATSDGNTYLFSTAGRSELGGNHTDHNMGKVLAATITLDTIAAVRKTNNNRVVLKSEGFPAVEVDLSDLHKHDSEENTTDALLRGIASAFAQRGLTVGGWEATTTTNVLKGSGLSSSAAIEVLCGTIFNSLYNNDALSPVDLAIIGKYAENVYFGKPSGLMDQVACAQGGIVGIDFADPDHPIVTPLQFSFIDHGYHLVIVDTRGNHADLTPDYASVPTEMHLVASYFGKAHLREVDQQAFLKAIPELRAKLHNDRAILRAFHFFEENKRVQGMLDALSNNDMFSFLKLVQASGDSSFEILQNLYSPRHPEEQGLPIAISLSKLFLGADGAVRVHGGGFAGTIQAYVPNDRVNEYCTAMDAVFGEHASTSIGVRDLSTMRLA